MYALSNDRERRLLWLLALTQFTIIMDFMVMMPLGPQIMRAFTITPAQFATAVSAYSWCSGLSGLFAATYVDRFDRRRLLLTIYALFAFSNLACALAASYPLLLIARAFAGITGGVLASVIMTIVSDVVPIARRGAATGIIMTAFSLAAVAGVPAGVLLGAHFSWAAPFVLLVVLSVVIWIGGMRLVPSLAQHLIHVPPALSKVLPELWNLLTLGRHMRAFALTFVMMTSHMLVIPFIAPTLVANHGVQPAQLAWMYMAGGATTFFTSRAVGRLADRYGSRRTFRTIAALSALPVLFITHLPNMPFVFVVLFFPFFMVAMSGRIIPLQALLTTVPQAASRGAFLSANSAVQALGTGCGAWLGGLMLSSTPNGQIAGYGMVGWTAVLLMAATLIWVGQVKSAVKSPTDDEGGSGAPARAANDAVSTAPLGVPGTQATSGGS